MDERVFTSISKNISSFFLSTIMSWGADNSKGTGGGSGRSDMATQATGMISPFTAVSSLGRGLQQITVVIWTAGLLASALLGASGSPWGILADGATGGSVSAVMGALKYIMATLVPVLSGVG